MERPASLPLLSGQNYDSQRSLGETDMRGIGLRSMLAFLVLTTPLFAEEPIDIGSRLELMVDDHLIESMDGVRLELHHPVPREVVLIHDAPWEGERDRLPQHFSGRRTAIACTTKPGN